MGMSICCPRGKSVVVDSAKPLAAGDANASPAPDAAGRRASALPPAPIDGNNHRAASPLPLGDPTDPFPPPPPLGPPDPADPGGGAIRLCLLGNCESGKTTVFEQIRRLSRIPVPSTELHLRRAFLYDLVVNSMLKILDYALKKHGGRIENVPFTESSTRRAAEFLLAQGGDRTSGEPLSRDEYNAMSELWDDDLVKMLYGRRYEFGLSDSLEYFFDSLPRIYEEDFEPVHEDLVMAYIPTVGVQDFKFGYNKREYHVFDVGGGKIDTRKRHSTYENLNGIIFMIAISNFDLELEQHDDEYEDPTRHSDTDFDRALKLLRQAIAEERFAATPIHVFLNEVDVFKEKLHVEGGAGHAALRKHYPEYDGSSDKDAMGFMQRLVEQAVAEVLATEGNRRAVVMGDGATDVKSNAVEFHFTCCVDTRPMQKLLMNVLKRL